MRSRRAFGCADACRATAAGADPAARPGEDLRRQVAQQVHGFARRHLHLDVVEALDDSLS